MGKTIAIMQSNYIPWKGYFDLIRRSDTFVIYDCVQYTKNDWRNRNLIKTPSGLQWLTIPVYHKLNQRIDKTVVSDRYWAMNHWRTISQFYCRAKYFDRYAEIFEDLYLNIDTPFLSEINVKFIEAVCRILGINTPIINCNTLQLVEGQSERLVDICKQLGADKYLSGPAAKNYLNVDMMNKEGIEVEWMTYDYPEYNQLYPPFEHGVTVLDLIFNTGEEAMSYVA